MRKTTNTSAPLAFLGLACAVGVSTIYYNQPLLLEMAKTFGTHHGQIGMVAVATQVGYAIGLLLLVPLGDVLERRALMMRLYGAVAVALLLVAVAQNFLWLVAGSVLIGTLASVTHIVLPIAPDLVDNAERGRAIGTVMTGLLLGILLARTFAGWVSHLHDWRLVFVVAAMLNASFVPLLWRKMPRLPPQQRLSYGQALRSLATLFRTQPLLREAGVVGGMMFAAFSCFWTTLVLLLGSRYGLGPGVAGSFGVVGAAGALVAPLAGRLADKHGSRWVLTMSGGILTASFLMMGGEELLPLSMTMHMVGLVISVVVLDVGLQMTQVANQTRIFGLDPSARSRLNTVYMVNYFVGGALGSGLGTLAWAHWGWNGVCVAALLFIGLGGLRHATGKRGDGPQMHLSNAEERVLEF